MKFSPSSSSLFVSILFLYTSSTLTAALSLIAPNPTNTTILNSTLGSPNANNLPPDPFQYPIHGTSTSLVLGKYGPYVSSENLVGIAEKAQYEIVKSIVEAGGDAPIAQPTFEWRHGRLYLRVEHMLELRWKTMAEVVHGVVEFGYAYGTFELEFQVLDQKEGVVGSGSVGMGYT